MSMDTKVYCDTEGDESGENSKRHEEMGMLASLKTRKCSYIASIGVSVVIIGIVVGLVIGLLTTQNGGSSNSGVTLPLIKPPVDVSVPTALADSSSRRRLFTDISWWKDSKHHLMALDTNEIKSRFFTRSPTNIYDILKTIDERIDGINRRMAQFTCINVESTPYSFYAFGANLTFYASCAEELDRSTSKFVQWGFKNTTSFYIYIRSGVTIMAGEIVTSPVNASRPNITTEEVSLYYSVGVNSDLSQSHGVVHVHAKPESKTIEMTLAVSLYLHFLLSFFVVFISEYE